MEVKWLEWHRGRLGGARPSKWEPFNKSLAVDGVSSFQVAVKSPPSMWWTELLCGPLGAGRGLDASELTRYPRALALPGWVCVELGEERVMGSRGLLPASLQLLVGAGLSCCLWWKCDF